MTRKRIFESVLAVMSKNYSDILIQTNFSTRIRANIIDILRNKSIIEPKTFPDIFIAEPRNGFHGLFIEIRTDARCVHKKDGSMKNTRNVKKASEMLQKLRQRGFLAMYGFGYTNTIAIIEEYLRGNYKKQNDDSEQKETGKIVSL